MVQGVRIEETAVLRQVAQLLGSMAEANDMDGRLVGACPRLKKHAEG
jgi:hypothetical protein